MAKKRLFAKRGFISGYSRTAEPGGFDLTRWLEDSLDLEHVPRYDDCCSTAATVFPVRANTAGDNSLEYFNGSAWAAFGFDASFVDVVISGSLDMNGTELILDADADTSLTADTDDQIDVKIAGADDFQFTANTFTSLSGSTIATNTIAETTAASGVTIDGALVKDGGISANSMFAGFFPTTAAQSLSGAGACNITSFLTKYTSTGAAQALTLAAGSQIGQRKKISHVVDGGSGIVTATYVGGTTLTFTTLGEFADLIWTGAAWGVLELGNTATPGTVPSLA